jgi:hypothetical protein
MAIMDGSAHGAAHQQSGSIYDLLAQLSRQAISVIRL